MASMMVGIIERKDQVHVKAAYTANYIRKKL